MMRAHVVFYFERQGEIETRESILGASDDDGIVAGGENEHTHVIEIMNSDRLAARFPPWRRFDVGGQA